MMAQREELSKVQELQCNYCEYHKALFGYYPRAETQSQWESSDWLNEQLSALREYQTKRLLELEQETAE